MPKAYTLNDVLPVFWGRIDFGGEGCWTWLGRRLKDGYGQISWAGKDWLSHHLGWTFVFGPIPDGQEVCHRCDNPACVRPSHLFLGTHVENMRDCQDKGRFVPPPRIAGERHYLTRFTEADIRAIRARYAAGGSSQRELAREYGVSQSAISLVVNRERWIDVA